MSLISQLRRLARRLFPVDEFHSRGVPHPLGAVGREAGVWIAYHLDGTELAYLIGSGPTSGRPIAIVFGSDADGQSLTRHDFQLAKAIALDWTLAGKSGGNVFDARDVDMSDPKDIEFTGSPAWFIFNVVLFPTDRFGRRVDDPRCSFRAGAMFSIGGGLFIACSPDVIPWHATVESGRLMSSSLAIERGLIEPRNSKTAEWLSLDEAAERFFRSPNSIRRRCIDLQYRGLARSIRKAGKRVWQVRSDALHDQHGDGLIPTFAMQIDGDWNAAPAGLADFIDRVNKDSGVLPESLSPGQSETNKAAIAAA
jgi:hypothetical protein